MNRTPVPSDLGPSRVTDKQLAYIRALIDERDVEPEEGLTPEALKERAAELSKRDASRWIDKLLKAPYKVAPSGKPESNWPDVPAGRYALEDPEDDVNPVKFYQVDRPTEGKWAGFTFLAVYASDETHPIRERGTKLRILEQIAEDPEAASARFGRETEHCGVCGRRLTREDSRERGIGPVCAARMEW